MAESKFSFNVLNVGQGSMQLIEEGDLTNIVVDCNISKAPELVRRYLGRRKVDHIDVVALTGTDLDHADPDGFQMLINFVNSRIGQVWYPGYEADTDSWKDMLKLIAGLKERGTKIWKPTAGEIRAVNGLTVRVLSPGAVGADTSNDASLVLKIMGDEVGILLPGDCESEERWKAIIKAYGHWLPSQILVAPHHGSKNGCVEAAIELIAPEYTVISCGEDNQHDHPDDEAVEIYQEHTSQEVYITHEVGTLLFESDGKTITKVVPNAGQDEAGRKLAETMVKRLAGRAARPTTTRPLGSAATLGDAVRQARPHQNAPQDRVGFGRV
jgi:competence protein ComEC